MHIAFIIIIIDKLMKDNIDPLENFGKIQVKG